MIYHFLKKIIFPFSVISFTSIGLIIYSRSFKPDSDIGGGFGKATVTISNKYFCNASEYNCVKGILSDFETYKKKVLLFGNSQLAAINQLENSQINYADNLSRKIEKNESLNLILRSFWMPNANLFEFNLINKFSPFWYGSRICTKKYLESPQWLRDLKFKKRPFWRIDKYRLNNIIENGGWHFCNLKPPEGLLYKYNNLCETNDPYIFKEKIDKKYLNLDSIQKKIEQGKDLIGRDHEYVPVNLDNSFPEYLVKNKDF